MVFLWVGESRALSVMDGVLTSLGMMGGQDPPSLSSWEARLALSNWQM
jgi:hypothetical protein